MLASCLMECVLRHWLMPAGLLQFEVVAEVVSRCMHSMFLTADTRSFKDSLSAYCHDIVRCRDIAKSSRAVTSLAAVASPSLLTVQAAQMSFHRSRVRLPLILDCVLRLCSPSLLLHIVEVCVSKST